MIQISSSGENHSRSGTLGSALPKSVRMWEVNCAFPFLLLPSVSSHTAHSTDLSLEATSHLKYPNISFLKYPPRFPKSLKMGTDLCFPSSDCSMSTSHHAQAVFQCKCTLQSWQHLGNQHFCHLTLSQSPSTPLMDAPLCICV